MATTKSLSAARAALTHPAALFSAGNSALALGQAEPFGIFLNIGLTATIFSARFIEVLRGRTLGIPFSILASVNFFTALSIEFNKALGTAGSQLLIDGIKSFDLSRASEALSKFDLNNLLSLQHTVIAGHVAAFAFVVWGIGHLFAGRHEKQDSTATHFKENPQTYYGAGDMSAVNASGTLNPYSFPFMVLGFVKSTLIGRTTGKSKSSVGRFVRQELTAARLYGIGYIVGAITSIAIVNFAVAQVLWSLAYFSFKKDT